MSKRCLALNLFQFSLSCFRTAKTYNSAEQCTPILSEVSVRHRLHIWFFLLWIFCIPAFAQQSPAPQHDANSPFDEDEARSRITHDMEKKAAKERVAALKRDTDKLLKLSVELKAYVDKSDENVLSLDVVRKAEEIEKLAKSVKDKMKGPN